MMFNGLRTLANRRSSRGSGSAGWPSRGGSELRVLGPRHAQKPEMAGVPPRHHAFGVK